MYRIPEYTETQLKGGEPKEGETIEKKVYRLIQNKEPIKDGVPLIWTDRKDGVNPAYNIRTDRWEIATDAMTYVMKSKLAKRDELIKREAEEKEAKVVDIDRKPESLQGKVS